MWVFPSSKSIFLRDMRHQRIFGDDEIDRKRTKWTNAQPQPSSTRVSILEATLNMFLCVPWFERSILNILVVSFRKEKKLKSASSMTKQILLRRCWLHQYILRRRYRQNVILRHDDPILFDTRQPLRAHNDHVLAHVLVLHAIHAISAAFENRADRVVHRRRSVFRVVVGPFVDVSWDGNGMTVGDYRE